MTSLERNGDVVRMASYAPLLANTRHTSWNPNLIYFSNTAVLRTANYYVQQLFAANAGDIFYPGVIYHPTRRHRRRHQTALKDSRTGDLILKIIHTGPGTLQANINLTTTGQPQFPAKGTKTPSHRLPRIQKHRSRPTNDRPHGNHHTHQQEVQPRPATLFHAGHPHRKRQITDMEKRQLISELQRQIALCDDMAAYRQLYDMLHKKLFYFSYSIIKSRETAEEIVSDVFIRLWRIRDQLLTIDNLTVFLYTIAKNLSINHITRNYKYPNISLDTIEVNNISSFGNGEELFISAKK
ncbi:alpha-L-arabinofuranosidase C-terminal domain-containing protein [Puia sp. P3]|uniref:alpha-L-arabinofuranosidase C-terminal domain-containing protein n=1 Tax=Puia sp. P3 TaxID=3423952 RepID=UPI003D67FBAE